jgi:hypothetical protein
MLVHVAELRMRDVPALLYEYKALVDAAARSSPPVVEPAAA